MFGCWLYPLDHTESSHYDQSCPIPSEPNDPGGNTVDNCVGWAVLRHHGPGGHHRAAMYRDAMQNDGAVADLDIVADYYVPVIFEPLVGFRDGCRQK